MKAAYIKAHGGRDVLKYGDLPIPEISESEVLVRLKYSALNHLDIWVRQGLPGLKLSYPHVLGGDGAGLVEKVGSKVLGIKPGDEVIVHPGLSCMQCEKCRGGWESLCAHYQILGEHVSGTNAEFVKVPAHNIFAKPQGLSFVEAAAIGLVFTTAWQMLVRRAVVKSGELVLIHAAGSGVSSAGIQIAKYLGATVIATAGSQEKLELAKKLGADSVVNYREQNFLEEVRKISKSGVDVVFEHVGTDYWEQNIKALKWGGRLVTCGATSGFEAKVDLRQIFYRQLSILGSTMGSKLDFPDILKAIGSGRLRAVVDTQYPLREIQKAHARLEDRGQFGKVVLSH